MLFPDSYYKDCHAVTIEGETYTHSNSYDEVSGFQGVSELTLIRQNSNGRVATIMDTYPSAAFQITDLENYGLKMYEKSYLDWDTSKCVMADKTVVTPQLLNERLNLTAERIRVCSKVIMVFVVISLVSLILELAMLHMYKESVLNKSKMDKITIVRRIITLVSEIVSFSLIIFVHSLSNDKIIEFLTENHCTNDLPFQ